MKQVAIAISGGGSNMLKLIEDMAKPGHGAAPCLVVSNVPDAGGLRLAEANGVPTVTVDHRAFKGDRTGFEAALDLQLRNAGADIVCLAGFMRILGSGFVDKWTGQVMNIHPSLLPKHKGLNTHQSALDAGDVEHGCTVHQVTAALDDGPILGQARVKVEAGDTADDLAARVLTQEHLLYPQVLRRFAAGDASPVWIP